MENVKNRGQPQKITTESAAAAVEDEGEDEKIELG
jgi:hypothetical protein